MLKKRPRSLARMQLRAMAIARCDQDDIALLRDEAAAREIARQRLVDGGGVKIKIVKVFGQRQPRTVHKTGATPVARSRRETEADQDGAFVRPSLSGWPLER